MSYKKLTEIKNSCRFDYFVMAVSHYFDIGHRNAQRITEAEIKAAEGNAMMSKEFVEWLMETAKKIADSVDSAVEVVQFCMIEDIFDTRFYAGKLSRGDLEEMVRERLANEDDYNVATLCDLYNCDEEQLELVGITVNDEET